MWFDLLISSIFYQNKISRQSFIDTILPIFKSRKNSCVSEMFSDYLKFLKLLDTLSGLMENKTKFHCPATFFNHSLKWYGGQFWYPKQQRLQVIQTDVLALSTTDMTLLAFVKIFYILFVVSFNLVFCNLYSDPRPSDSESCDAKDHSCLSGNRLHDTEEIEGPTIIGRDGLTRLDGIKVSCFNTLSLDLTTNIYPRASCLLICLSKTPNRVLLPFSVPMLD